MSKQLAIELRRLLKSPAFYIAVGIGLYISISHVVQVAIPLDEANDENTGRIIHSVFTSMLGMGMGINSWQPAMLINITPILVSLPFGISFYLDKRTGYIKNLFTRQEKKNYLVAKYIATFVSGGFVLALTVFANFIGNCMILPLIAPMAGTHHFANVPEYLQYFYYEMPVIYILCVCFIQFVIGGLMATMCLGATYIVDLVFLVQLFPVVFVYVFNTCASSFEFLGLRIMYDYLSILIYEDVTLLEFAKVIGIMAVFSMVYFINGYKEETL